ncbi:MAG: autotransporter domain-containing protein [Candidatus Omnitrophica bacterium]|nr:autotransporter domain-containing protein [Candidatus Omnitrophota bacterium]
MDNSGKIYMTSTVTKDELINANLVLKGTDTLSNQSSSNSLTVEGGISGSADLVNKYLITSGSVTLNGVISDGAAGTLQLLPVGGIVTVNGANTYSGGTAINGGEVIARLNDTALGTGNVTIASNTGLYLGQIGDTASLNIANSIYLEGSGDKEEGALVNCAGNNTVSGVITMENDATISCITDVLTISNKIINAITGTYDATFTGEGDISVSGSIGTAADPIASAVNKQGSGALYLLSANYYSGGTSIAGSGGGINIRDPNALGTGAVTIAEDTTLELQNTGGAVDNNFNSVQGHGPVTWGGAIYNVSGDNTISGTITQGGDTTIVSAQDTLSLSGAIGGAYDLTLTGDGDIDVSGVVSAVTSLTKDGAGTLTLSGLNTYTGDTTVSGGTLKAGVAAQAFGFGSNVTVDTGAVLSLNNYDETIASLSGAGTVNNTGAADKTLTINDTPLAGDPVSSTFSGAITDGGAGKLAIIKDGTFTLNLTGANDYSGGTTINLGTLKVGNSSAVGTGALENNDTLDLGTTDLSVTGVYTQAAGSQLNLTADSSSSYGKITSGVAAVVDGGSTVNVTVGGYIPNSAIFTIIDTGGTGITGDAPATVTSTNQFVKFSASESGNNIILISSRSSNGFASVAGNSNAADVGRVLDNMTNPTSDMTTVLNILSALSSGQVASAEDTMHTTVDGAVTNVTNALLDQLTKAVILRLQDSKLKENESVPPADSVRLTDIWAQTFGDYARQNARGSSGGYMARLWGQFIGVDRGFFGNTLRLGAAQGFSWASMSSKDSSGYTGMTSYQTAIYGQYDDKDRPYLLDALVSYGYNDCDGYRHIYAGSINRTARSDYGTQQFSAYLEAGYRIKYKGLEMVPILPVNYTYLFVPGYTERDADSLNLTVGSQSYNSMQVGAGLRTSYANEMKYCILTPEFHFRWFYDVISDSQQTTAAFAGGGTSFQTTGFRPSPSTFNIGARLEFFNKKDITLLVACDTVFKEDYAEAGGSLTCKYGF